MLGAKSFTLMGSVAYIRVYLGMWYESTRKESCLGLFGVLVSAVCIAQVCMHPICNVPVYSVFQFLRMYERRCLRQNHSCHETLHLSSFVSDTFHPPSYPSCFCGLIFQQGSGQKKLRYQPLRLSAITHTSSASVPSAPPASIL